MRFPSLLALVVVAASCSPPPSKADAGPDTSCGLDCASQAFYGLVLDRCFEYSESNSSTQSPPSLGVWVRKENGPNGTFVLEGDVPSIVVEYRKSGQIVQSDYFTIKSGDLYLLRRIAGGSSVTYRTDTAITGVKWFSDDIGVGQSSTNSTTAFLSRDNSSTATSYPVITEAPNAGEKKAPLATYDTGIKVIFGESPDHGSDPRRVFVPNLGFTMIASPFSLLGGAPTPHYLQRVRDIGTPDAGPDACSLGVP